MLKRIFGAVLVLAIASTMAFTGTTQAAVYGSDGYGKCTYGSGCQQHTIITTPSGLEIAVNIVDGQQISTQNGYDIVITPLNGSGSSFQKADIYINGKLVTTVEPAENGTAIWHWNPAIYPGTVVKVVATDKDGKTVSKQFTIVVTSKAQPATNSSGGGATPETRHANPVFKLAAEFVKSAQTIIKSLPKPVVVAFPYLLFVVLLVEILILILQTKRELRELHTLRALLAQEREVSALKQGFLQLVSHYLRTPLTILKSGSEGLSQDGVAQNLATSIQQAATNLGGTIESIISSIDEGQGMVVSGSAETLTKHQARQRFIIWLPVGLVGVFAASFVYLANSVTEFDASVVSMIIQVTIYIVLASAVYQGWRRLHLHRRDGQNARLVLSEAAEVQTKRDEVINTAAERLRGHIAALESITALIPPTAIYGKFIAKGISQLKVVLNEFMIANKLKGARSTAAYEATNLSSIFESASKTIADATAKKNISLKLTNDLNFSTQSVSLTTLVMQTLLDNAVAYSPDGATIEVSAQSEPHASHIFVTDHGQGIPAEKIGSLFQPFSKAEGAEVFTHEGMGFSLYLDKLILTYLGGDIAIESKMGEGTQVSLAWNNM
jgi:signal transduction histidine kinase